MSYYHRMFQLQAQLPCSQHTTPTSEHYLDRAQWRREETLGLDAAEELRDRIWLGVECGEDLPVSALGDLDVQQPCGYFARVDVRYAALATSYVDIDY